MNKNLRHNLSFLRKSKKVSIANLAQNMQVSEETVIGWEFGTKEIQDGDVLRLATFYDVDPYDLANKSLSKMTKYKNKTSTKSAVFLNLVSAGLSIAAFIFFSFNLFKNELTFFELLFPNSFAIETLFAWVIFVIILFNIINGILMCAIKSWRQGTYGRVSKGLSYSLNVIALIFWISILMLNTKSELELASYALLGCFGIIIALSFVVDMTNLICARFGSRAPYYLANGISFALIAAALGLVVLTYKVLNIQFWVMVGSLGLLLLILFFSFILRGETALRRNNIINILVNFILIGGAVYCFIQVYPRISLEIAALIGTLVLSLFIGIFKYARLKKFQ